MERPMKHPNGDATPTAIEDSTGDVVGRLSEQQGAAIHEFVDIVGSVENANRLLDKLARLPNAA